MGAPSTTAPMTPPSPAIAAKVRPAERRRTATDIFASAVSWCATLLGQRVRERLRFLLDATRRRARLLLVGCGRLCDGRWQLCCRLVSIETC